MEENLFNKIKEVSKTEILLLIMDYLYSIDYINTLVTLEQESKLSIFYYKKELSFLRKLIMEGNWTEAENFILPLQSNTEFNFKRAMYYLKIQKFFETTEDSSANYDKKEIEFQLKELRKYSTEEHFKKLLNLLTKNSIRDEEQYKNWTVYGGRLKTFEELRKLLVIIYPINENNEKKIKDDLLIKLFIKIAGKDKINRCDLINQIDKFINDKNIKITKEEKEIKKVNKNNENVILNDNNKNIIQEKEKIENKNENKNDIKKRPQSGKNNQKIKKAEIDAASTNKNKSNIIKTNDKQIKPNEKNNNIQNNETNTLLTNINVSNLINQTDTSSLIKDTKKIIKDLGGKESNIKQNNPKSDNPIKKNDNNDTNKNILKQNYIHQIIQSPYDLFSYDPSSFCMDTLLVDSHPIRACSFSADGDILALGTNSKSLKFYDFKSINNKFLNRNENFDLVSLPLIFEKTSHHNGSIYCLDWSYNQKLIVTGSNDKTIKIFVVPDFEKKITQFLELAITDQKGTIRSVLFPPGIENNFYSGGGNDSNIYMWDTESGKKINTLNGHEKDINSLKFSIDENSQTQLLGSCGKDNKICFYDNKINNPVKNIEIKNHGEINDISFSNDYVCSGHGDGYVCIYSNFTQEIVKEMKISNSEIRAVNFSKDGKYLLTASFDNKVNILDVNDELKVVKTLEHDDKVVNCRWHPDKPIFVTTSADKTARIWTPKIY